MNDVFSDAPHARNALVLHRWPVYGVTYIYVKNSRSDEKPAKNTAAGYDEMIGKVDLVRGLQVVAENALARGTGAATSRLNGHAESAVLLERNG